MPTRAGRESATRISDCVIELLKDQPFFGSLALRLPIRSDASRETLASDGKEIRYSPGWIATTDAHLIKTAIARVVLACALKHHTRRADRDPERWQRASQLVTHHLLEDAGFILPPDAEAWPDLSAEEAYDRLPEPEQEDSPEQPSPSGSSPQPADGGVGGEQDEDDRPSSGTLDGSDPDHPSDDSSDGDSDPDHSDPPSTDPSGTGEIMDAAPDADMSDNADAPDFTQEEQDWDEAMHQALNLARAQGNAPGAIAETVEAAHRSTLDWRPLLRRYMTDTAKRDYSWSVPNRRFIDSGLYLPSIRSEGMEAIAVIVDSSRSVDRDTLGVFWSHIRHVAAEIEPGRVIVLQVDAELQDERHYHPHELPLRIDVKGRYGTDFRPGFARLAEQGIRPAVCLYFTDMECDNYPETRPDFPVLWCNFGRPPSDRNRPPWGELIQISAPTTR
ncbi:MAG: VWA-like domain-containing protein [Defluviicoccus sp.]|nr:VWA-like domain-containing protein [Defluviicoccus sp.]MDE0276853.1 VWA-like domain-containing protein [Defluviicoccus sp.]